MPEIAAILLKELKQTLIAHIPVDVSGCFGKYIVISARTCPQDDTYTFQETEGFSPTPVTGKAERFARG